MKTSPRFEIDAAEPTPRGARSIARIVAAVLVAAIAFTPTGCGRGELADAAPGSAHDDAATPPVLSEEPPDSPTASGTIRVRPKAGTIASNVAAAATGDPGAVRVRPLLERVVVIGASVSAGFGTELPLANLMDAAIAVPHEPVVNASERMMGVNPVQVADAQVNECLDQEATLVVAIDFLFWFAYGISGNGDDEFERRDARFQKGLEHLDRLTCPVVLGDIPNMRHKQRYITDAQVPSAPVLAALNAELRRFAKARDNVFLIPLDRWMTELRSGAWSIPDIDGPDGSTKPLPIADAFLPDRLHPSKIGTLVLTGRLVEEVNSWLRPMGGASAGLAFDLAHSLRLARQ